MANFLGKQRAAGNAVTDPPRLRPGDPDDADAAGSGRGGDGSNGVDGSGADVR
jgi:hypothetical protein